MTESYNKKNTKDQWQFEELNENPISKESWITRSDIAAINQSCKKMGTWEPVKAP